MQVDQRISIKEKIGYGLGDTASNLYFQMFIIYLLFFYTDVFGISAAAAGTMLMVSRFWDAVNDPLMGILADRTHTRWGKFRPYLIWISVPIALIGVATFYTPDLGSTGKLVYAYITYTLMMMAYTAINIPYSALMGVLSPNTQERTSVSTYRFVLAFAGAFVVQGLTLPLVKFFGGGDQAVGFPLAMAVFGVLAAVLFYATFATTRERVQPPVEQRTALKEDLKDLTKNRPWMILLVMSIASLAYAIVRSGSVVYYFKYYVGNEDMASSFMVYGTVAVIVGVACTQALAPTARQEAPVPDRHGRLQRVDLSLLLPTQGTAHAGLRPEHRHDAGHGAPRRRCCGPCMPIRPTTRSGRTGAARRVWSSRRRPLPRSSASPWAAGWPAGCWRHSGSSPTWRSRPRPCRACA